MQPTSFAHRDIFREHACLLTMLVLVKNDVTLVFDEEALSKTAMKRPERVLSLSVRIIRMDDVVGVPHR